LVELICVDPKRVHEFWPYASEMIRSAIRRTNLSHTSDTEYEILSGDGLLWLAWNGEKIEAAASTHLIDTDADKICVLTACGGENMHHWLPLLMKIEQYAKDEGCKCVRIFGRKGWLRILKDYEMTNIVIEKAL
jgi:hypothetical protein